MYIIEVNKINIYPCNIHEYVDGMLSYPNSPDTKLDLEETLMYFSDVKEIIRNIILFINNKLF